MREPPSLNHIIGFSLSDFIYSNRTFSSSLNKALTILYRLLLLDLQLRKLCRRHKRDNIIYTQRRISNYWAKVS